MALTLRYAARSDVGMVRAENEDSGYAGTRMLVVADGMGGHAAGELASATTVATFADLDLDASLVNGTDVLGLLATAVDESHDEIAKVVEQSPASRGMGTTVTALAWLGDRVALAHIGDSRAYLLRDHKLMQLTKDHTYVQSLVDAGRITPEEALTHGRRNLLTKALDGVHEVECDLSIRQVQAGDRFLLCTDGLHGVVSDEQLQRILDSAADPTGIVDALVSAALEGGAPDNVTALVADVMQSDESDLDVSRSPIVVGAAAETRNRERLPGLAFPEDSQPNPDQLINPSMPTFENVTGEIPTVRTAETTTASTPTTSPRTRLGFTRGAWLIAVIVVVLLVGAVLMGWNWTRSQYYVGSVDGKVAVFQGIPQGFGPHGFSTIAVVSDTDISQLPDFERSQVDSLIPAENAQDAQRVLNSLAEAATKCAQVPTPVGCPPPATPAVPATPTAPGGAP